MPSANQLRAVIENQLSQRISAALSPSARVLTEHTSLGVPALGELIEGLPVGAMSEITGVQGSGRTALACAAVSNATQAGQVAAWVDVSYAFEPVSAAANHIRLDRMLWVRCGQKEPVAAGRKAHGTATAFANPQTARVQHGGGSPHPRSEARGLSEAVNALLASPAKYRRDRVTGTPGAPNRRLQQTSMPRSRLSTRIEQAGTDRQPSRRGMYVLDQRELFTGSAAPAHPVTASVAVRQQPAKPWDRIDQALRVTDLLLQAGGFSVVVLDLADIAAEFVSRIPMATWFRFRASAEHAQSALLVLTQHASTGSSAALVLKTQGLGELESATYFPGLRFSVEVGPRRFAPAPSPVPIRKPPQRASAAEWSARSIWGGSDELSVHTDSGVSCADAFIASSRAAASAGSCPGARAATGTRLLRKWPCVYAGRAAWHDSRRYGEHSRVIALRRSLSEERSLRDALGHCWDSTRRALQR